MVKKELVSTIVSPLGTMNVLSNNEVSLLQDTNQGGLYPLFRQCALAVLNCDETSDNPYNVMEEFDSFDIRIVQEHRGLKLELINAPGSAFVDGRIIKGIRQSLFCVVRDILYVSSELKGSPRFDNGDSTSLTDLVFHILRNAKAFLPKQLPNVVVCWGGHSIGQGEYKYTKKVGYQLGLRGLDICTGCGPGAMKGPMKGANLGHAKQRISNSRFIGITEPGIIAAESPNPIVNQLIIMPDIEKRLEAFVRFGHGIIIFPGGPGTCEEILYLLGILLHPDNEHIPFPLIFTGPSESVGYFEQIDRFIGNTLGPQAQRRYNIIIDDPREVAQQMKSGLDKVTRFRRSTGDAYYYNWLLRTEEIFQAPFEPTHESMEALQLDRDQPAHMLAANLRRAMSGVVAGNVKRSGIDLIRARGPFQLSGDPQLMEDMDQLLGSFVKQQRMKLPGSVYEPCYEVVHKKV
ncbi:nucleotide 5'-monophosphate nucleosidase PpnN [Aestuariirhabdus haliotis]|uniref:nucleotide 5'-monophosphate nucleosidase PpnN n=1 Tax=Aestuariirhabdus haliotis TaxID=2918751 RepID=UPI0029E8194E|nr:nucleotide 5'-monophosphate nucleosidase PpnN [Aestuariirhabdus haliotis]